VDEDPVGPGTLPVVQNRFIISETHPVQIAEAHVELFTDREGFMKDEPSHMLDHVVGRAAVAGAAVVVGGAAHRTHSLVLLLCALLALRATERRWSRVNKVR
jgi:hypothetical protein